MITFLPQGPDSGYTQGKVFWVHAALRSSASPVVFRRWREPFRGAEAKCCSSVRVNTGGKFNQTFITGVGFQLTFKPLFRFWRLMSVKLPVKLTIK